jgi:hypothetical protein
VRPALVVCALHEAIRLAGGRLRIGKEGRPELFSAVAAISPMLLFAVQAARRMISS